jgi:hypothetical protein
MVHIVEDGEYLPVKLIDGVHAAVKLVSMF